MLPAWLDQRSTHSIAVLHSNQSFGDACEVEQVSNQGVMVGDVWHQVVGEQVVALIEQGVVLVLGEQAVALV